MERRVTSHTEEEEMNQRRKLLSQARKGDQKAISKLFELYQVKLYTGDLLKKVKALPSKPSAPPVSVGAREGKTQVKGKKVVEKPAKKTAKVVTPKGAKKTSKKSESRTLKIGKTETKVKKGTKAKPKIKQGPKSTIKAKLKQGPKPKIPSKAKAKATTPARPKRKPKAKKK